MNPARANLHAFFTFTALRMFDVNDCVEMRTASVRHDKLSLFHDQKERNIRTEAWKPSVFRTDCR